MAVAALCRGTSRRHGVIRRRVVPEFEVPPMSGCVRKPLLILHHHSQPNISCLENALPKFRGTEIRVGSAIRSNTHGTEFLHQLGPIWPFTGFLICGKSAWLNIGVQHLGGLRWLTIDDTDLAFGVIAGADVHPLAIADRDPCFASWCEAGSRNSDVGTSAFGTGSRPTAASNCSLRTSSKGDREKRSEINDSLCPCPWLDWKISDKLSYKSPPDLPSQKIRSILGATSLQTLIAACNGRTISNLLKEYGLRFEKS